MAACATCGGNGCVKCKGALGSVAESERPWPYVSLCMIVRDASQTIDALIDSVVNAKGGCAVDELVIIDTGSVDDTREKWTRALTARRVAEESVSGRDELRPIVKDVRPAWPAQILKHDDPRLAACHESGDRSELEEAGFVKTYGGSESGEEAHVVGGEVRDGSGGSTQIIGGRPIRVVFARYAWHHDFAAARNFSFRLASGKWRMYLDADDTLPLAHVVRRDLALLERRDPTVNVVTMEYLYSPTVTQPDSLRIVRWADGWEWTRRIHENLVRTRGVGTRARVRSKWTMQIVHHVDPDHFESSVDRNITIARLAYAEAVAVGDTSEIGMNAYFIGQWERDKGLLDESVVHYEEAARHLAGTNMGCMALVETAQAHLQAGRAAAAVDAAGRAIACAPELREGYGLLGVALYYKGEPNRAAYVFDAFFQHKGPLAETTPDRMILDVLVPVHAAVTYLGEGRFDDAAAALARAPIDLVRSSPHDRLYRDVAREIEIVKGLRALDAMWTFWLASNEGMKLTEILDTLLPETIARHPRVVEYKRRLAYKLRHLESWEAYKKAYDGIPSNIWLTPPSHAERVLQLGRAEAVVAWAKALPKEGPPVRVCAIGSKDNIIESAMLDANPRLHVVVCEVAEYASESTAAFLAKYPGRTAAHLVRADHLDWPVGIRVAADGSWRPLAHAEVRTPLGEPPPTEVCIRFDAVVIFEVIEHLPDDTEAMYTLNWMLRDGGELFLSTPISAEWIESYLAGDVDHDGGPFPAWHFFGHVRGYSPESLWALAWRWGFTGSVRSTDGGILFLAHLRKVERKLPFRRKKLSIYCPWTPLPFDPQSLHEGHVGGSEEAVIRLAPALAARGIEVTVFAGMPERDERTYVHDGVRWRPNGEFDPRDDHGTVLLWRAPQVLLDPPFRDAPWRKFSWLHDLAHGADPKAYDAAEKVIVLSKAAVSEVMRLDGAPEAKLVIAQNGIDGREFPELVARVLPTVEQFVSDPDWKFMLAVATRGVVSPADVTAVFAASRGVAGGKAWRVVLGVKVGTLPNAPDAVHVYVYAEQPAGGWGGGVVSDYFYALDGGGLAEMVRVLPNVRLDLGIVLEPDSAGIESVRIVPVEDGGRDPHKCIYAQSPNRGLSHLLAIWPEVRKAVPDATLDVYYDWTLFRRAEPAWAAQLDARIAALAASGVTFIGGVSHDVLFAAYRKAGVWSYPSSYCETFCTSAIIAQASGCWPVTTMLAALEETVLTGDQIDPIEWPAGTPFEVIATERYAHYPDPPGHEELLAAKRAEFRARFLSMLIHRLLNPPSFEERVEARRKVIAKYDWAESARIFESIIFPPGFVPDYVPL